LRERYLKTNTKKEKNQILENVGYNTGVARKYFIRKIQPGLALRPKPRRESKQTSINSAFVVTSNDVNSNPLLRYYNWLS